MFTKIFVKLVLAFVLFTLYGCDKLWETKCITGNTASETDATRVLESFLGALQQSHMIQAYACLSQDQQKEVSFTEFAEGYWAHTIQVVGFEMKGVAQADAETMKREGITSPLAIPEGTLDLDVVKDDALTPPGVKRRMSVPLSWILLVEESGKWRVKSKGWGPLHTVAFFGRPKTIIYRTPNTMVDQSMRYEDDDRTYSIILPADWDDYSRHPALNSIASGVGTKIIAFIKQSNSNQLPNITIQTYDLTRFPSVKAPIDYARMASAGGKGTELHAPINFSRDGISGARWEYELSYAIRTRSITDYYLDGRTLIMVASTSATDQFERDKQDLLPILNSFRFSVKGMPLRAQ